MKILSVVLFVCFAATARAQQGTLREDWEKFKIEHNKTYYEKTEQNLRFLVFAENWRLITRHNKEYQEGRQSYAMAINHFTDWLHSEFLEKMTTTLKKGERVDESEMHEFDDEEVPTKLTLVPDAVDWRDHNLVTPVKNQGSCGSCWAFSATGALEGLRAKQGRSLIRMSEQHLVDCSWDYGNYGCSGGLMNYAFRYVIDKGIAEESEYPYEGTEGACRNEPISSAISISGYANVRRNDEAALKSAVAAVGPISVGINAGTRGFQFYSQGVFVDPECSNDLNHGVLVVGYGTDRDRQDYWLVKNSWGTQWGDKGYIKMARNKNNQCGIAALASFPRS